MKKLVLFTLTTLVIACGGDKKTKPEPKPEKQVVYDCVFPNTDSAAPGWICDEPVPGLSVSAVGVAPKSSAGISYQKDIAALDGRGRLAEQMKVQVSKMVKQYLGTTGVKDTETVDAAASTTLKSVTSESLLGSKIYKTRMGPNGRLFALIGIDEVNYRKIAQAASRSSMKNDAALWQQFKSKQSFDEMANDIANQQVQ